MSAVVWLQPLVVEAIHLAQLSEHGGASGIRDRGLFETALAKPQQLASYGDPPPDIHALAAAYARGIAHLHPFIDGNKRTSLVAALLFLRLNGFDLDASQGDRYLTWMALAEGELDEVALAAWLRERTRPM
ncbi:MAG: type II toxin-antitoxin system death-on-curing family toxin [Luteimonas sp.]